MHVVVTETYTSLLWVGECNRTSYLINVGEPHLFIFYNYVIWNMDSVLLSNNLMIMRSINKYLTRATLQWIWRSAC